MTWTSFHRRGDVLRDVIAAADQRLDGTLPRDVDGVSATSTSARFVEAEYCWRRPAPGTATPGTRGTSLETDDLLIVPRP